MWYSVDRIEGRYAVLVPAWFDPAGPAVTIPATRTMRPGYVYRWTGRYLVRDKAYEKRAARAAAELDRQMTSGPGGNIRL